MTSTDFSVLRTRMVDGQVRTTDVTDSAILEAMLTVPREAFVPRARQSLAYIDEDIEVAPGRFLMEASPFAKMLQLAEIAPGDVVLDVGCATGYSVAILSRLASSVVALECDPALAASAGETLSQLGHDNVAVVEGLLEQGYPSEAPYDVIFVGGAVDEIPEALLSQMKDGGRLVAVVGQGNAGVARVFTRSGEVVSSRRGFNAAVQPLPGFLRAPAFEF